MCQKIAENAADRASREPRAAVLVRLLQLVFSLSGSGFTHRRLHLASLRLFVAHHRRPGQIAGLFSYFWSRWNRLRLLPVAYPTSFWSPLSTTTACRPSGSKPHVRLVCLPLPNTASNLEGEEHSNCDCFSSVSLFFFTQ